MAATLESGPSPFPACNYPKRCSRCSDWIFLFDSREEFIKKQHTYQHVTCKVKTPNSSLLPANFRNTIIHQYSGLDIGGEKAKTAAPSSIGPSIIQHQQQSMMNVTLEPQILNMHEVAAIANNTGNLVSLARLNIRSPAVSTASSPALPRYRDILAARPKLDFGTIIMEYPHGSMAHWIDTGLTWETLQEYITTKRNEYPFNVLYGIITLKKVGLTLSMIKRSLNVKESASLGEAIKSKKLSLTKKEWNVLEVNNDNYNEVLGLSWFEWMNLS